MAFPCRRYLIVIRASGPPRMCGIRSNGRKTRSGRSLATSLSRPWRFEAVLCDLFYGVPKGDSIRVVGEHVMGKYRSALVNNKLAHECSSFDLQLPTLCHLPIVDQCCRRLESAVSVLLEEAKAEATWTESYAEALKLLDSIPFDAGEFAIAQRHLRNALDYCFAGEFGAACFELRQLRSQLAEL
jgi:hypothetical protein